MCRKNEKMERENGDCTMKGAKKILAHINFCIIQRVRFQRRVCHQVLKLNLSIRN